MGRRRIFTHAHDDTLRAAYRTRGPAWCAKALGFTVDQIYGRAKRLGLMGSHTTPRQGNGRAHPNSPPSYDHRALAKALGIPASPPDPGAVLERHYMGGR
jgi:hypothetical protein